MELPELAIPSYKRSTTISEKTLKFLSDVQYPAEKITIFVADEEESQRYYHAVPKRLYGRLIVGLPGLMEQRNFITKTYPEDSILVCMDDDISRIDQSAGNFLGLVRYAVERLNTRQAGLFGVLPNDDKRRYKSDITIHLSFIIGSFFICRIHHDIEITYAEKDDYERSILYFVKYGQVLRYRGAGVQTKYTGGTGGLQEPGRLDRMRDGAKNLQERYPGFVRRYAKNGRDEVMLNWRSSPEW
jgi:hypothetical protein